MLQLGNINSLFRTRERSKLEGIAIQTIAIIDTEKTNALFGRTEDGKIVRKRRVSLVAKNTDHSLQIITEVNLAEDEETRFDTVPKKEKIFSLEGMQTFFHECPTTGTTPLSIEDATAEFTSETIHFSSTTLPNMPYHLVILLTHNNTSHQIHIDQRTGLTYEQSGPGKDANGNWPVRCN